MVMESSPLMVGINTNGDFSNKMSATGNQIKENLKFAGEVALTAGAVGIPAAIAIKYNPVKDTFVKNFDKGMKFIAGKTQTVKKNKSFTNKVVKFINSTAKKFKNASPKAKIIGTALAIAAPIVLHLNNKHKINTGKNIQLHNDRAAVEARTKL